MGFWLGEGPTSLPHPFAHGDNFRDGASRGMGKGGKGQEEETNREMSLGKKEGVGRKTRPARTASVKSVVKRTQPNLSGEFWEVSKKGIPEKKGREMAIEDVPGGLGGGGWDPVSLVDGKAVRRNVRGGKKPASRTAARETR